jgi:hypothetical protein
MAIRCPNGHIVPYNMTVCDLDLVPCEQCGPDEFIRISLSMEHDETWRKDFVLKGSDSGEQEENSAGEAEEEGQ